MAVWLIARYGTGLHLHTPAFGSAHRPATLTPGAAAAVTAMASAAACGVLYLIERTARNARRAWTLTSLAALAAHLVRHGIARLGTCQAAPCNCVYVDHSRARTRRYCCDQCNDRAAATACRRRKAN